MQEDEDDEERGYEPDQEGSTLDHRRQAESVTHISETVRSDAPSQGVGASCNLTGGGAAAGPELEGEATSPVLSDEQVRC